MLALGLGALIGVVLALSGAGGGILAVPLLVFGLDLPVNRAAPVSLIAVGVAAAVGAALGLRDRVVRYRAAALIGTLGMASAPFGVGLAQVLPNRPLLVAFSLVLTHTAWRIWRRARAVPEGRKTNEEPDSGPECKRNTLSQRLTWTRPCARALAGTGLLSGLLSGLLGVGGGFVIVPALTRHTDLDPRSVLATSLAVIALVSCGGILAAAAHGAIDWSAALPFAGGATAALLATRPLSARVAGRRLQQAFALICALAAALVLARGVGALSA